MSWRTAKEHRLAAPTPVGGRALPAGRRRRAPPRPRRGCWCRRCGEAPASSLWATASSPLRPSPRSGGVPHGRRVLGPLGGGVGRGWGARTLPPWVAQGGGRRPIDQRPLTSPGALSALLDTHRPGDVVTVDALRCVSKVGDPAAGPGDPTPSPAPSPLNPIVVPSGRRILWSETCCGGFPATSEAAVWRGLAPRHENHRNPFRSRKGFLNWLRAIPLAEPSGVGVP